MSTTKIRVVQSWKRDNSWHGQYFSEREDRWLTVSSNYGPIEYTTPEYARAGVAAYLETQQS